MPRWTTVLLLALSAALLPSPVLPLQVEVEAKRGPELTEQEQAAQQPDPNQRLGDVEHRRQSMTIPEHIASWARSGARILIGQNSIRPGSLDFFFVVFGALAICMFAGLMSGLTLGLLSVEERDLEVIMRSGKREEVDQARKVKSLVKDTHQLLVTLLLCNACAMEALPILLDMIMSPGLAIILSVTGVLFFGEILPQAICKSMGLTIGAMAAPLVWALLAICYPVARPIAMLLDYMIGSEHSLRSRPQIKAVLEIHKEQGELMDKEATVMGGALDLALKTCGCCMQSVGQVKSLSIDAVLDDETMDWIIETGYSRIPICEKGDSRKLRGVLLTKRLVKVRAEDAVAVKDLLLNPIHHIREDMPLYDLLDTFRSGKSHMAAVYSNELEQDESGNLNFPPGGCAAIGIVTLEDVIEELINEEILDEMDDSESNKQPPEGARRRHGSGIGAMMRLRNGATPKARSMSASV